MNNQIRFFFESFLIFALTVITVPSYASIIGDFVWEDMNINGIQEAGEPGIAGVTVDLKDSNDATIATTTTDATGSYLFDGLDLGVYSVEFTALTDFYFTPADQGGDDAIDSDADQSTGQTATTTLGDNDSNPTLDAGLFQYASLGDLVWEDMNINGIQDAGELGVAGVTVNLYQGDYVSSILWASTNTDSNGLYLFEDLIPDDYFLEFLLPSAFDDFTVPRVGGDPAVDSDATGSGHTHFITLSSGEYNSTMDAGLIDKIPEPTTLVLMGLGLAGIGYRRHCSKKAS